MTDAADLLTVRQRELLALLALGKTVGEAADLAGCTEKTAENRLADAYRRLGVANRTEAFAELGWLAPRPRAAEGGR